MRAVILAAGQGTRLHPLTEHCPKGMVRVGGKPIIEWQIELFRSAGIEEVAIVKGYKQESVPDYGARHFVNAEFDSTNMVHSLFCADEFLAGEVILSYGDILYSRSTLERLLEATAPIAVAVDLEWEKFFGERFDDAFEDAESLEFGDGNALVSIGKRDPRPEEVQAQYIGLIKTDQNGIDGLRKIYRDGLEDGREIGWGRPCRKAYMTDLLQEAIDSGLRVEGVRIRRGWVEIDNPRDFEIAGREISKLFP